MSIDYQREAKWFIDCAFDLLNRFNSQTKTDCFYNESHFERHLTKSYFLRINEFGKLFLVKRYFSKKGDACYKVIGHTFLDKYSQTAYIGNLLTVFINDLETCTKTE